MSANLNYGKLTHFLLEHKEAEVLLPYEKFEEIIGGPLPPFVAANPYRFFYNNETNGYFKYWNNAGFKAKVLPNKSVIFIRFASPTMHEKSTKVTKYNVKTAPSAKIRFSNEDLNEAEKRVNDDLTYGNEAKLIEATLKKYPSNTDPLIVGMKIGLIDITNSTNLARHKSNISIPNLVDLLVNIPNFDERLRKGDLSLVREISKKTKEKHGINLFSFATKYCCYHNLYVYGGDAFSIFDSELHKHLVDYSSEAYPAAVDRFRTTFDFEGYSALIGKILSRNSITTKFKRRKFDYLVWYSNR